MRRVFVVVSTGVVAALAGLSVVWPQVIWSFALVLPLVARGYVDMFQRRQAVRRNFPLLGNMRYLFELIRPEINQYFVESDTDGKPFDRETRSLVYQRAKRDRKSVV